MYAFIGKHTPEIVALLLASVIAAVTSYLAWTSNAAWLNRGGALIIIVGVLLAASRFHEWIRQKFATFVEQNYDSIAESALSAVEAESGRLPEQERLQIKAKMKDSVYRKFSERIEEHKRRLKAWEVWLVVTGTFLNGLGDWLVQCLKNYGT